VVVATMGLAAGINFSLRSVALAAESYRRDQAEQMLRPDEILQMFGRAGRRGLDEVGYVLITANEIRLLDARPCHLSRNGAIDWAALLGIMSAAAEQGSDPFRMAMRVQERLFTTKPIALGIEESLRHPDVPCGLKTDAERSRHVRKRVREMMDSRGQWQPMGEWVARPVRDIVTPSPEVAQGRSGSEPDESVASPTVPRMVPVLSVEAALEKVGTGHLTILSQDERGRVYGRALTVADRLGPDRVILAKWIRRLTNWNGRQAPLAVWEEKITPLVREELAQQRTPVVNFVSQDQRIVANVSIAELTLRVPIDRHGVAIWKPVEREVLPQDCARCEFVPVCRQLPPAAGVALVWRRLGLINSSGAPTLRGKVVSFFSQGDGLAIAAALEDISYPMEELIYDLANLDGGYRFCGEDNRWGGRLALVCHDRFGLQSIPGYLENGVPPKYGAGAEQVVASVHKNPLAKHGWVTELLGPGDIDRVIIEWRSLLRQISHAPDLEWPRWRELQGLARTILNETQSPTLTELPALEYFQTKRMDHRLILRRH
ncbi:MAG TPA: DEAD/DEAH box helicase, partial [Methylomirabilota bacterium]|nr:DEAD/DEAH box helicase [Methylomirabilota bacterium]